MFTCLCAHVLWMNHSPFLALCDPAHRGTEVTPEHQAVEDACPVLLQLVVTGGVKVMLALVIHPLKQNFVLTRLPCVQVFPNPPSNHLRSSHVERALQNHRL